MDIAPITAAVIVKIAYLASGLVVCFLGKGLLEKGVAADFVGEGEVASRKLRIVTSSPGLVFLLAGLAILVVGIQHQSGVSGDGGVRLARQEPKAVTGDEISRLARSASSLNRPAPLAETEQAKSYFDAAVSCIQKQRDSDCFEPLIKLVALDPGLVATVQSSPALEQLVRDPVFAAYASARLRLFLRTGQASKPLSQEARGLLARIGLHASAKGRDSSRAPGDAIERVRAQLLARSDEVATVRALEELLDRDPRALYALLSRPENSWALENDSIHIALSRGMTTLRD